jgi:serine acetyltransferase
MRKSIFRRILNRFLHSLARTLPGATGLRPMLHRLRGVKIGKDVFIADDVYLENEYPEAVEIQEGVQISVRAIIIAHTRGPGRIIIEKNAYLGPNTVVATSGGKSLRIGQGAVIGAGVVIGSDVAAQMFIPSSPATPVAKVMVPLAKAERMEDFIRGLAPIRPRARTEDDRSKAQSPEGRI